MSLRAAVGLTFLATGSEGYSCTSDVTLPMTMGSQKGLALDDTTFHWCPDQIPATWPNTQEKAGTMRIFKAWQSDWQYADKHVAWKKVADYVKSAGAKVLLGTAISCNETADDADWADVSTLLKLIGSDNIMGVSIGNELDLLWQEGAGTDCVTKMWSGGYFQKKFDSRAKDLDTYFPGAGVAVTTVFSEFSLAGKPFVDDPTKAMVNTFLTHATKTYQSRYAHSLNLYPYFDESNKWFNVSAALKRSTCFDGEAGACLFSDVVKDMRKRIKTLTGADGKLWIAETGWSSPAATTLPDPMKGWDDYSGKSAFKTAYSNFLNWDMKFADGTKGPDHIFYFTMRDAPAFGGAMEAFGLIGDELGGQHLCQEQKCKIQASSSASLVV